MQIDRPKIKELAIRKIPLFGTLGDEARQALSEKLTLKDFEQGASILLSGQPGHEIMFVADGVVDIRRTSSDGKEVIISRLGIGEFFGELALLTGAARTADVVAVEDCMILILREDDFESLLATQPSFSRALMVDLARRVSTASARISDLALLDVALRVHSVLVTLSKRDPSTGERIVDSRPTHRDLASMVGSSREMVTRAIKKLEDEGRLRTEGERVFLD